MKLILRFFWVSVHLLIYTYNCPTKPSRSRKVSLLCALPILLTGVSISFFVEKSVHFSMKTFLYLLLLKHLVSSLSRLGLRHNSVLCSGPRPSPALFLSFHFVTSYVAPISLRSQCKRCILINIKRLQRQADTVILG